MADSVYFRPQVEQWRQKLEEIAVEPRTTFTKSQVVEELIDTIEKALQTRSYAEVAEGLKDWGLDITEGSLKQYVSRYRKAHKSKAASARSSAGKNASKKRSASEGKTQVMGQEKRKRAEQLESERRSGSDSLSDFADEVNAGASVDQSLRTKTAVRQTKGFIDMPDDL